MKLAGGLREEDGKLGPEQDHVKEREGRAHQKADSHCLIIPAFLTSLQFEGRGVTREIPFRRGMSGAKLLGQEE